MSFPRENVLIVDNGTGYLKAGFAGDNMPRCTVPAMVGRPVLRAEEDVITDTVLSDIVMCDEAERYRRGLDITYPIETGIIRHWEDMERIWSYVFEKKLCTTTAGKRILLTEAPMNPKSNRDKMYEVMFEKFGVDAVNVQLQAMLTLYAQGLLTGLVVDSGDGVTHVVAAYDGITLPHITGRLDVAGRHITRYLIKLLLLRGYALNRSADLQTAAEIKNKLCYVAMEPEKDRRMGLETTVLEEKYRLPDGRTITVGRERFEAPEALFRPAVVDVESPGISELVEKTIQAAETDVRAKLYQSIVLSGGTTMFPGFSSRLLFDLKRLHAARTRSDAALTGRFKVKVEDPPRRKHMVFIGAATLGDIMASRSDFWRTKAEYEEEGARRLVNKAAGTRPAGTAVSGSAAGAGSS